MTVYDSYNRLSVVVSQVPKPSVSLVVNGNFKRIPGKPTMAPADATVHCSSQSWVTIQKIMPKFPVIT